MTGQRAVFPRRDAVALAAAALLFPVAPLLRGPLVDPRPYPASFATWVTGPRYQPACILFIADLVFHGFASLALASHLANRGPRVVARWGGRCSPSLPARSCSSR